jgi:hypothetical protein
VSCSPLERARPDRRLSGRSSKAMARLLDRTCASTGWSRPVALVTGFWRSGTTWLQELLAAALAAKTTFEPLSPRIPEYAALMAPQRLPGYDTLEAFMPCLDRTPNEALWRYLDDAFHGFCSGHFTLLCRSTVRESLRRRVVVKCVRLQFSQTAVHERYGVPVIHLRRHPCAVAASLKRTRWAWSFDGVRLADLGFRADGHRLALFGDDAERLAALIGRFDADPLSRAAACWALSERYVEERLADRPWARILGYEAAVAQPEAVLAELGAFLRAPALGRLGPVRDSPVTEPESRGLSGQARAEAWRHRLTVEEIDRVREIVGLIFPQAGLAG